MTDKCPWCGAAARDPWNFECGSICTSPVTASPVQADSCRIGKLTHNGRVMLDCLRRVAAALNEYEGRPIPAGVHELLGSDIQTALLTECKP